MNDIEWQRPDLRPHIKRISAAAGWRWRQRFSPRGALRRRVAGQGVLITGPRSGIGGGPRRRLARAGATVLLVARSLAKLQDTVDDIQADGGRAHAYRCDLADLDSCDRLCEQVLAEHGGVDILVNNAGRSIRRSVMHSLDRFHDYQRTMQLNYFGAIRLAMNLIPAMQARGQGHVINVSTMGVQSAPARFSAYLGSKSALEGWTLAAQNELVHTGVEFTLMNYPLVRTPMIAPTAIYRYVPAMSEERAVDWLCEAGVTRPKRKVPACGLACPGMYQVLPKTSELIVNTSFQLLRDKRR